MSDKIEIIRNPKPMGEQVEAITNLNQDLMISAGAGSGKTWVLTQRYLEILSKGYSPAQIVAITFTRKAAGEMKGRIRQAIQQMARLSEDDEEKTYWEHCENEFRHGMITTIHGFCTELLRSHPLEAKVSPRFRVLDSVEADLIQRDIYTETARELLDGKVSNDMVFLYEELASVQSIVLHALALAQRLKTFHKSPAEFMEETNQMMGRYHAEFKIKATSLLYEIDDLINEMKDELSQVEQKRAYMLDMEDWFHRYESLRTKLAQCGGEVDEELFAGLVDLHNNRWRSPGKGAFATYTRTLRHEKLQKLFEMVIPARYRIVVQALLHLIEQAEYHYKDRKDEEQVLDFHDIESITSDLLHKHPEICGKWQQRIDFLMIDEFQDTNELQKSIFDQLSANGQAMKRFVVGDGKQSIYRFRGADIEVFYKVEKEIGALGGRNLSLVRNFRSQKGVIAYINSLFQQVMQQDETSHDYVTRYERLDAHRVTEKTEPHVEFLCSPRMNPGEETEALSGVEHQADLLTRRVKKMVDQSEPLVWNRFESSDQEHEAPISYGDVAVLLSTRTNMHVYELSFREYGIPYVVLGGRQYYEKQEVLDVLNLMHMIQHEDDEVSLLSFLRSPFVQLKDESLFWLTREQSLQRGFESVSMKPESMEASQWTSLLHARKNVNRWREQKGWQSTYDLLDSIVEETGYRMILMGAEYGEQQVANVDKFLGLVQQLTEQEFVLYDIVEYFRRLQIEEIKEEEASVISDQGNAVVIMSIHASKGLEFPVVFIPELEKDHLRRGGQTSRFFYHPDFGAGVRLKNVGLDGPGHGVIKVVKKDEEAREIQEAIRLLYVAMTRAKDHLVLLATEWDEKRKPSFSWLQLLMEHFGWDSLEERHQRHEPIRGEHWQVRLFLEKDLPNYPKVSEYHSRLDEWIGRSEEITNQDLPPFPLLTKEEHPYPWLQHQDASHLPQLSASALMLYESCQRAFYLQYVLGAYGVDEYTSAIRMGTSVPSGMSGTDRGTIIHHLLETELFEEETMRQMVLRVLPQMTDISEAVSELKPYISAYQSFVQRQPDLPYEKEKNLMYIWDGHRITGQLDWISYHPDGEITIVDFKTNLIKGNITEVAETYHLQGYLYVELAEQVMKCKVKSMKFVFLENGQEYDLSLDIDTRKQYATKVSNWIIELREKTEMIDYTPCYQDHCVCAFIK